MDVGPDRLPLQNQEPIFSKTLRIESKTIFIDIKENESGPYLKIAERSTKGDRQTVIMALSGIRDLRDALDEALEKISTIQENQQTNIDNPVLFVSNLHVNSDEQMMTAYFGQVGEVLSVEILRELDGSSKGQALITYNDPRYAQEAVNTLDNTILEGVPIKCKLDRRKKLENKSINEHRVYVSKLNWDTTIEDLTTHFETIGLVTKCVIKTSRRGYRKQSSLGAGWVEYMDPRCATTAVAQLSGSILDGHEISVRVYYD